MNENKSKTDIVLKVLLSICLLGLIPILIILMSFFFKDRFTSLDDYEYSYTLRPGFYEVGVHLPAGTYVVQLEDGKEAEFSIYNVEDSYIYFQKKYYVYDDEKREKDILKQPYFGINAFGRSVSLKKRIKNITLEEGELLNIEPQTSFIFYSNDVENTSFDPIEVTYSDIPIVSDVSIAGEDFPAGVYDILYEPKDSNQVGTIKCAIKDIDASYSVKGYSFDCEGKNGTQVIAHGIPFTPGSNINTSNIAEITLVPTKYISKTFNSLTWEADSN